MILLFECQDTVHILGKFWTIQYDFIYLFLEDILYC